MIDCHRENHGVCGELTAFVAPIFGPSGFTLFALKLCSLLSLWCWVETCDWLNYQRHQVSHNKQQHACAQSCPTLCDPVGCSPPGSSVHGISQASILEWVAISFSRGSSRSKDWTHISCISCLAGGFFTTGATWEAHDWLGHIECGQGHTAPCLGLERLCVPFLSSNPAISPRGCKESGMIERLNWTELNPAISVWTSPARVLEDEKSRAGESIPFKTILDQPTVSLSLDTWEIQANISRVAFPTHCWPLNTSQARRTAQLIQRLVCNNKCAMF